MLRVTELKLPLGHPPDALRAAVRGRLGLADADLLEMVVARRANDARRKSALRYGYLNAGMWAATAVSAGVTTYLYFTRPARVSPTEARIVPWAEPHSAGLSVSGGF